MLRCKKNCGRRTREEEAFNGFLGALFHAFVCEKHLITPKGKWRRRRRLIMNCAWCNDSFVAQKREEKFFVIECER
jgi:hypothetical protein